MADYQTYSCSELLILLDKMYAKVKYSDKTNYAEYLLTMESAESIDQLIKIYDKIYIKLLNYAIKAPNDIPSSWSNITKSDSYLASLNGFFNEQIERLFYLHTYSDKYALKSLVNLRTSLNYSKVANRITAYCSDDVKAKSTDIYKLSEVVHCAKLNLRANSSTQKKLEYKKAISSLLYLGYKRSIRDKRIGNIIGLFVPDSHFFIFIIIFIISLIATFLIVTNDNFDNKTSNLYASFSLAFVYWSAVNIWMNYRGDFTKIKVGKFSFKQQILLLLISILVAILLLLLMYLLAGINIFTLILIIGLPGALITFL